MDRVDAATARRMIAEKQSVEVGLSLDVQEIFNDHLIGFLRELCQASIREIDKKVKRLYSREPFIERWKSYPCMRGMQIWVAMLLLRYANSWSVSECADWIRIYSEIVEAFQTPPIFPAHEDRNRRSYQEGSRRIWEKFQPPAGVQATLHDSQQPDAWRRRVESETLIHRDQQLYALETTESGRLMRLMPFAGSNKWALMVDDVTCKMDRVFGLMKGAAISGTTTDNIYFLKKFCSVIKDPILYLLPIGSIVGGGHHSLLEVAIPLTMCGLMDYSVGLYSTLIPRRPIFREALLQHGADDLARVCKRWEEHAYNHLLLCYYYKDGDLKGAYVVDKTTARWNWLKAFRADENLMRTFAEMANYPSEAELTDFLFQRRFMIGY